MTIRLNVEQKRIDSVMAFTRDELRQLAGQSSMTEGLRNRFRDEADDFDREVAVTIAEGVKIRAAHGLGAK